MWVIWEGRGIIRGEGQIFGVTLFMEVPKNHKIHATFLTQKLSNLVRVQLMDSSDKKHLEGCKVEDQQLEFWPS